MKIIRTSFNQLLRNKMISAESEFEPDPVPVSTQSNSCFSHHPNITGKFTGGDDFVGNLSYKTQDGLHVAADGDTWITQGPIGFGNIPTGPGTKPYYTYLSNAVRNTVVDQPGIHR